MTNRLTTLGVDRYIPRGYPRWLRESYSQGRSHCPRMLHEFHSSDRGGGWPRTAALDAAARGQLRASWPDRPTVNLLNINEFARRTERSSTGGLSRALAANRDFTRAVRDDR